ncbi:unnamed protein product [Haemonchus placei]|uniref:Uncharacterized protein n=1 Tax=Haemonchus placei TaxID=6290 RepID=A0A0N4W8L1_HAEPC|nr:unnamed protein product [Haemonchus placei]
MRYAESRTPLECPLQLTWKLNRQHSAHHNNTKTQHLRHNDDDDDVDDDDNDDDDDEDEGEMIIIHAEQIRLTQS